MILAKKMFRTKLLLFRSFSQFHPWISLRIRLFLLYMEVQ